MAQRHDGIHDYRLEWGRRRSEAPGRPGSDEDLYLGATKSCRWLGRVRFHVRKCHPAAGETMVIGMIVGKGNPTEGLPKNPAVPVMKPGRGKEGTREVTCKRSWVSPIFSNFSVPLAVIQSSW